MTDNEKTRLIAEFDGWTFHNDDPGFSPTGYWMDKYKSETIEYQCLRLSDMQFSTSYDWLMPVWHKFRDLRFEDNLTHLLQHGNHSIWIQSELSMGNINGLFEKLAEAIEWYNTTNK